MYDLSIPENRISQEVIDACISIHMALGPGLFERIYENAPIYELGEKRRFPLDYQFPVQAYYEDQPLGESFYADLIVDQKVILEIKSVERLLLVHFKQLLTYLRLTDMKLGLLINFNEVRVMKGIHRIVNGL